MPNMTTIRAEIKKLDPKQAIWNIRKVDLEEILKNLREANENTLVEVEDEVEVEVEDEVEVEIEVEIEVESDSDSDSSVEDEIEVLENELTEDYKDFYKDFVMEEFHKEVKHHGRGSVRRGQNLIIYHRMIRNHGTILIAKDREFYTSL